MKTTVVAIPTSRIFDWATFHGVFEELLGFPPYYGGNMNAWIDCMTYVDDPDAGMVKTPIQPGELLALRIDNAAEFQRRRPEQYDALVECAAFVNYSRIEQGRQPVLTLMLCGHYRS